MRSFIAFAVSIALFGVVEPKYKYQSMDLIKTRAKETKNDLARFYEKNPIIEQTLKEESDEFIKLA